MLVRFENEQQWLEARKQDVTSTEVAALFGLNPFKSRLQLWHEKAGNVVPDYDDNPFMKWGRRLQSAVALGIAEDEGWGPVYDLRLVYARDENIRSGSSFDFKVQIDTLNATMLEVKVAERFREEDGWFPDKAPIQYEFQMQAQLHHALREDPTIKDGTIGALGARQSTRVYRRIYDPEIGAIIDEEIRGFWKSIAENTPPDPDFSMDGDLLAKLRGPIRHGDVINLSNNPRAIELIDIYQKNSAEVDKLKELAFPYEAARGSAKTELLHMIGRNETAIIGDTRISAKEQVSADRVIYGSSFRRFDVKKRKN